MMSSCFKFRKSRVEDREPLLPQYHDDTSLQRQLHQKLHTYQALRALSKGFMPSNEQAIINLRTLLAADILNPDTPDLSNSGRLLVKYTKQWLKQLIELLQHKNSEDQIQDFIWFITYSRISVDVDDMANRASKAKGNADTVAAYKSLQTIGAFLLGNSDFRLLLSDLSVVTREVLRDTAFTLSDVAKETGEELGPSQEQQQALNGAGSDSGPTPSKDDLEGEVTDVTKVVGKGTAKVAMEAEQSLMDNVSGAEKETMVSRLKQVIMKLRKRPDYSESVSMISLLIKRYAAAYSRAVTDTVGTIQDDIGVNSETDRALQNFWMFITSFGDHGEWEALESNFKQVMTHRDNDTGFEDLMADVGNSFQKLLMDPDFLEHADQNFQQLRGKARGVGTDSSLRQDIDNLLDQTQRTFYALLQDEDIGKLKLATIRIVKTLSPGNEYTNGELVTDFIDIFMPLLIQAIQYVPIPRLEVSTPEIDLLLENLIIEPGRTINHTSFLPYKLRVETYNGLEIRKARFRTTSKTTSLATIEIDGLSLRADEMGFWLRTRFGLLRLADDGIASFQLDERGIDIRLDIEIGKEKLEKILMLKDVRVHIHKLNYTIRQSRLSFLGWLFKPLIRPIIRKVMERKLASAIADGIHAANRELLYARERLRATRISDPDDLLKFFKAVAARLKPEEDPDLYTRVGIAQPGEGVFKGVYAPGSVVKLWNEEFAHAGERVEDYERGGWKNEIFDVHTRNIA